MWEQSLTVVAGADLSAQQYKFVSPLGVLAGSETNVFGVLQGKQQTGEHATVVRRGFSRLYVTGACSRGDFIGQSNTTSGAGTVVTSGVAFAQVTTGAASGGIAMVDCFGQPTPIK
jgi:hypothetical protein